MLLTGLVMLLVVELLARRTPLEERQLLDRFGLAYQKDMEQTGRLFPRF
jgi:protein-S-isoprenylcysteine O-methyltransferase Ste14